MAHMNIHQFQIGRLLNFTYLIISKNEALVIDPQQDLSPWWNFLEQSKAKLTCILLTHTHYDHVPGVQPICEKIKVPIYLHQADAFRLENWPSNIKALFRFVTDGEIIEVGHAKVAVIHTPGHSAGECCYFIQENDQTHLFTGDTIFVGNVGRTDLETGSTEELFQTIQQLKKLPLQTLIYPGHNYGKTPTTTLERERKESEAFHCKTVQELDALP